MATLSKSAQRVQEYLSRQDGTYEVRELSSSTRTAQDAADSVGCEVGQIAKSLVFAEAGTGELVLVIASGANRVDVGKIEASEALRLRRADGNAVKKATGFAIGGIPPVGHDRPLTTLLDRDLKRYETIWAAAGTPHAVFRLTPEKLERLTGGRWLDLRE